MLPNERMCGKPGTYFAQLEDLQTSLPNRDLQCEERELTSLRWTSVTFTANRIHGVESLELTSHLWIEEPLHNGLRVSGVFTSGEVYGGLLTFCVKNLLWD